MTERHKVFVSYHHENDQAYRERFERICRDVMDSRSVDEGDIDPNVSAETVAQRIRDEYLRESTVTLVLVGRQTWQRKHVDWEIGSSIRHTEKSPRSGLLGILLPTYPGFETRKYNPHTIPPRLWDNIRCKYAEIYLWNENPDQIQDWIHAAYLRKDTVNPDNSRVRFGKNHTGPEWTD